MNNYILIKFLPELNKDYVPAAKMDMCKCANCDWSGPTDDCETEMESDGWEYPEYEILLCPKCEDGGCIDDYWYSDEELQKLEVEKYNKTIQLDE